MFTTFLWQQHLQRIVDDAQKKSSEPEEVREFVSSGKMAALLKDLRVIDLDKQEMVILILSYLATILAEHRPNVARHIYSSTSEMPLLHEAARLVLQHVT